MREFPKLAADPGRITRNPNIATGQLALALVEIPRTLMPSGDQCLMLAASTATPGWRRQSVEISHGGRIFTMRTPPRKSVLGKLETSLADGDDDVTVRLHDREQWLTSCSVNDLDFGENAAAVGGEIIQFAVATSLGEGRFQLSRLRRSRADSGMELHEKGATFVLLGRQALEPVGLPLLIPGELVRASAQNGSGECSLTLKPGD